MVEYGHSSTTEVVEEVHKVDKKGVAWGSGGRLCVWRGYGRFWDLKGTVLNQVVVPVTDKTTNHGHTTISKTYSKNDDKFEVSEYRRYKENL